jgi:uncharacterized small protein (DUF1192 family)
VGETIARSITLAQLPEGFFSIIEDHDRALRAERTARTFPPPKPAAANELVSAEDHKAALGLLDDSARRIAELEGEVARIKAERASIETQFQVAEMELETERVHRDNLQALLDQRRNDELARALPVDVRDAPRAVVSDRGLTPHQCLRIISAVFSDRVVILEEAYESALEADVFRNGKEVLNLLSRLAGEYWERLQTSPGDAHRVFGKAYASCGSETEERNPACKADRTRTYGGKQYVMWPHLKAGGNGGPDKCLRIHFVWLADEKKILIGHCGRHLKEV